MTLNQILYFNTLADCKNMGQAAEKLFISQPSLSVSLAKLEKELGISLFSRKGHRMELTAEGEAFWEHVKKVLKELDETKVHMRRLAENRETMIRLGCITPLLRHYFPERMRAFLQKPENGHVRFEFSTANTAELIRRLKNGLFDFLLCSKSSDEDVEQVPLISQPLVFIAPKTASLKSTLTWKTLVTQPLIGYEEHSVMDEMLQEVAGRRNSSLTFSYRAPTEDAIASLVEHGFGCALIPWSDVIMETYQIQRLPLPGDSITRHMYLTTLKGENCQGAAKRFIQFLQSS